MASEKVIANFCKMLKAKVPEEQFEDFVIDLKTYYDICRKKYSYLQISKEAWDNLFIRIITDNIDDNTILSSSTYRINEIIKNTIRRNLGIPSMFVTTVDGIFYDIDVSRKGVRRLTDFVAFIGELNLSFDESFYQKVKDCPSIRNHLRILGCYESTSYIEWQKLLGGFYDNYLDVRPYNMSLSECVEYAGYLYGLLGVDKQDIPGTEFTSNIKEKIRLILLRFKVFRRIRVLYGELYGTLNLQKVDSTILKMDIDSINGLFDDCEKYDATEYSAFKDNTFLYRLNNRVQDKKGLTEENNYIILNSIPVKNTLSDFYDNFPLIPGIDVEMRKRLVDSMVDATSEPQKQLIIEGMETGNFRCTASELREIIENFQKYFNRRIERFLNPRTKYDEFSLNDGFPIEKRKEFVDKLFGTLTSSELELMNRFLNGDLGLSEEQFREANRKLSMFQKTYNSTLKRYLDPRQMHDYMLAEIKLDDKNKDEIVKETSNESDLELVAEMEAYFKGTKLFLPDELVILRSKVSNFKMKCTRRFNAYKNEVVNFSSIIESGGYCKSVLNAISSDIFYELGKQLSFLKTEYCRVFEKSKQQYEEYKSDIIRDIISEHMTTDLETLIRLYIRYVEDEIAYNREKVMSA